MKLSKQKKIVNLFFISSPLHYFVSERVVDFFEKEPKNCLFIMRPYLNSIVEKKRWTTINECYPPKFCNKNDNFITENKQIIINLNLVINECREADQINLHTAFISGTEVNFFIKGILNKFPNSELNIRIIPEGLGKVVRKPLTINQIYRQYVKKILKLFFCELDYYTFRGDRTGSDDILVDRIYVLPKIPSEYDIKKIVEIPSLLDVNRNKKQYFDTALVIGQPLALSKVMEYSDVMSISVEINDFIKSQGYTNILYKPHPREISYEFKHENYELLHISESLEGHLCTHEYGMVIGICSTSLLTARMILSEKSRVISYGFDKYLFKNLQQRKKLYYPFELLDIEMIDSGLASSRK